MQKYIPVSTHDNNGELMKVDAGSADHDAVYLASDVDQFIKKWTDQEAVIGALRIDLARANDAAEKARLEAADLQLKIFELHYALALSPCHHPIDDDNNVSECVSNGHCGCRNKALIENSGGEKS